MSAAWSPDGSMLATISSSNDVMLWNTAEWQGHRVFGGPLAVVKSLAFCGDGKTLVVATDRAAGLESRRSDASRGGPNLQLPIGQPRAKGEGSSSKQAPTVVRDYVPWQSTTDTLRFFEVRSGIEQSPLDPLPALSALSNIGVSPSRKMLAAASKDGSLWIWDMRSRKVLARFFLDEEIRKEIDAARSRKPPLVLQDALSSDAAAPVLTFSPDGARLAACDRKGTVRRWDTRDWHESAHLVGDNVRLKVVVYSPDGLMLAVNNRGQLKLCDARSGDLLAAIGSPSASDIRCGHFSPDGNLLAIGTVDGSVRLIEMSTRSVIATLVGHGDTVPSLDFSPDGRTLATGSWDTTVRLWDVASKREVAVLEGHRGRVHAVAFSPDATVLASGGEIDDSPEQGLGELFLWRTGRGGMKDEELHTSSSSTRLGVSKSIEPRAHPPGGRIGQGVPGSRLAD
jgi:WD40 repeat protein